MTWAGCSVSPTTPRRSSPRVSRSISSRRRPPNACERLPRVVAAAVEAPVDRTLDARPRRPEQGRHSERRHRHREARLADGEAHEQHAREVGGAERGGQRGVDQRAVDDDVDVVEPVLEDGHGDRDGQRGEGDDDEHEPEQRRVEPERQRVRELADDEQGGGVREPLELLALVAPRAAQAGEDRHGRGQEREPGHDRRDAEHGLQRRLGSLDPERVAHRPVAVHRAGEERLRDRGDARGDRCHDRQPAPAPRLQAAVGEDEQQDRHQPEHEDVQPGAEPRHRAASGEAGVDEQGVACVLGRHHRHRHHRADGEHDAPHGVLRPGHREQRADGDERQGEGREQQGDRPLRVLRRRDDRERHRDREDAERGDDDRGAPHASLLSHSETCVGWTVSRTTPRTSAVSASRSSSSRSRTPNASSVCAAS